MATTWTGRYNRQITPDEQLIYDHLLYWIEVDSPLEMIDRFRKLFIDGVGYPDQAISAALDQVISSKLASEEFRFVLNRCCHILINRWQTRSSFQMAIPHLIKLFETIPDTATGIPRGRSVKRLRQLVQTFTETEQYLTLSRLAQVVEEAAEAANAGSRPLGSLIRRYPYLYEHCLLSEDSSYEQQETVRQIQASMQRRFELDLSKYVTYQVRRSQLIKQGSPDLAQRLIQPVKNPTLLADQELGRALKHYVGRVEGSRTYRDLAQNFLVHSQQTLHYRTFKDDLYQYITASVDPEYGKRQFNNQLYEHLKKTLPESNSQRLNDFLLVRTCNQLLSFLVVDNSQRPEHYVFVDLITNLGPILTVGIVLKIVLLCRKIKPSLEKRLSVLFNHYEPYSRDAVQWLVQALENLNVALSTHFGAVDLSFTGWQSNSNLTLLR